MRRTLLPVVAMMGMWLMLAGTSLAYYDPTSGRFLSPDPLGHDASMDLYSYADGDPINACDPDGRFGKNSSSSRLDDSWSQGMIQGYNQEMRAASDARASLFEQSFGPSPREAFIQQMERELNLQAYLDATTPTVHDPFANVAAAVIRATVDATGFGAVGTFMHDAYTGRQWMTGEPVSEGQAAANMLMTIGTMPLMMGGTAMRPAATVMTRSASRTGTGLVGRGFIPQLERAAGSRTITVIGSGDDVARYANKPGFNVFPPEAGLSKQELDRANAFWLNQAIRRGDTIWQVTNPQRWAKFMARKGKRSAYLDLELLMLEQYTGVKPVPAWVP